MSTYGRVPLSFEKLTVSTSVVPFSSDLLHPTFGSDGAGSLPNCAFITVEGGNIRFRIDGGTPTSIDGHLCSAGDSITIDSYLALTQFLVIRAGDQDAILQVTYFF